jgi:pyruvate-ferredoxin/flavodoxin oxidoreductase
VPFHEYVALGDDERDGLTPFIYTLDREKRLQRMRVADEIVRLAADRLLFWDQLRELAGVRVAPSRARSLTRRGSSRVRAALAALRAEYERSSPS